MPAAAWVAAGDAGDVDAANAADAADAADTVVDDADAKGWKKMMIADRHPCDPFELLRTTSYLSLHEWYAVHPPYFHVQMGSVQFAELVARQT